MCITYFVGGDNPTNIFCSLTKLKKYVCRCMVARDLYYQANSFGYCFVCKLVIIIHSSSIKASICFNNDGIYVIRLQSVMLTINVSAITSIINEGLYVCEI